MNGAPATIGTGSVHIVSNDLPYIGRKRISTQHGTPPGSPGTAPTPPGSPIRAPATMGTAATTSPPSPAFVPSDYVKDSHIRSNSVDSAYRQDSHKRVCEPSETSPRKAMKCSQASALVVHSWAGDTCVYFPESPQKIQAFSPESP